MTLIIIKMNLILQLFWNGSVHVPGGWWGLWLFRTVVDLVSLLLLIINHIWRVYTGKTQKKVFFFTIPQKV